MLRVVPGDPSEFWTVRCRLEVVICRYINGADAGGRRITRNVGVHEEQHTAAGAQKRAALDVDRRFAIVRIARRAEAARLPVGARVPNAYSVSIDGLAGRICRDIPSVGIDDVVD